MADVKVSNAPMKDQRSGTPGSQQNKDGNQPTGKKNMNSDNKQNIANKKRKPNHNGGPPGNSNNANVKGEPREGSGGTWTPGPGGPQPFMTHRLTGAPAWDLQPQNSSSQTFTGMIDMIKLEK